MTRKIGPVLLVRVRFGRVGRRVAHRDRERVVNLGPLLFVGGAAEERNSPSAPGWYSASVRLPVAAISDSVRVATTNKK